MTPEEIDLLATEIDDASRVLRENAISLKARAVKLRHKALMDRRQQAEGISQQDGKGAKVSTVDAQGQPRP